VLEGELHGPIIGLGSGIGEERARQPAVSQTADALRQRDREMTEIATGAVDQLAGLFTDGLDHTRVAMADRAHARAGFQVYVRTAFVILDGASLAFDDNRAGRDRRDQHGAGVIKACRGALHGRHKGLLPGYFGYLYAAAANCGVI
jgi:hypothetical protein